MSTLRGPRIWVALGVLLAVVLSSATYLLVIAPARTEAATVRAQVDDASVQQIVLQRRLRDLAEAATHLDDLRSQLAAAQTAVPTTADTQGLLRRVQAVAGATGTTVDHVTVKDATASSVAGVWAVPVDLSLLGTADSLLAALGQLQAGGDTRLVTVGSGTLETVEGTSERLTLVLDVYATSASSGTATATAPAATGAAAGAAAGAGVAAPS